jgi:outer membrane protein assembly factor BamB
MPRGDDDERPGAPLSWQGIDTRPLPISRRALLLGVSGTSIAAATVLGVIASRSTPHRRHSSPLKSPVVSAGPPTVRISGTLGGPRVAPAWSGTFTGVAHSVGVAGETVFAVDGSGTLLGFDRATGAARWESKVEVFVPDISPMPSTGGTVYAVTAGGAGLAAIDVADGTSPWQVRLPNPGARFTSVQVLAGSTLFGSAEIDAKTAGKYTVLLWAVDTASRQVAWTLEHAGYLPAVAVSEKSGVLLAADRATQQLAAYSLKDRTVLWRKDPVSPARARTDLAPVNCVAASGSTFYWAADQLYALDATTGSVQWKGAASGLSQQFLAAAALPGQGPNAADLVVTTATGPGGGTLYAFAGDTGAPAWSANGDPHFGPATTLISGISTGISTSTSTSTGISTVYTAERANSSICAVDAKTGETRWTFQDLTTEADLPWFAAVDEKHLYVAYSSRLLAFDV